MFKNNGSVFMKNSNNTFDPNKATATAGIVKGTAGGSLNGFKNKIFLRNKILRSNAYGTMWASYPTIYDYNSIFVCAAKLPCSCSHWIVKGTAGDSLNGFI